MLVTEVIAPVLGSVFLNHGYLYSPVILGLPLELCGIVIIWMLPETLKGNDLARPDDVEVSKNHVVSSGQSQTSTRAAIAPATQSIWQPLRQSLRPMIQIASIILKDIRLSLTLFAFMVNKLSRQILDLLVQYASKRLEWTVAKVRVAYQPASHSLTITP
jgi:hypothetical protein